MQYSNKSKWAPTRKPGIQYISGSIANLSPLEGSKNSCNTTNESPKRQIRTSTARKFTIQKGAITKLIMVYDVPLIW